MIQGQDPGGPIILITDVDWPDLEVELRVLGGLGYPIHLAEKSDEETLLRLAPRAAVIMVCFATLSESVIHATTQAKAIFRYGVGVDKIDIKAAESHGIPVHNVPDYCVGEDADHALMLLLALIRKLPQQMTTISEGGWAIPDVLPRRLEGLTIGLMGMGRTAQALAKRVAPLGMNILYTASSRPLPSDITATHVADRGEFLAKIDCLSVHLPLNEETASIINRETFALMKPESIIINIARGGLIDTDALVEALQSRAIAGAGIDVTQPEPLSPDHPLRYLDSCILTPHFAYKSDQATLELRERIATAAALALTGQTIPPSLTSLIAAGKTPTTG
jgi:D-3-phosphoglycerate dehydrogenase